MSRYMTLYFSMVACLLAIAGIVHPADADPKGGTVVSGSVTIKQSGNTTTINEWSNQGIINWQSFGVSANQLVKFIQPSQLSVILNRVTGIDPSVILGSIQANGRVFLINP